MADAMQQYGNQTTFNLESVLAANLASSRYSAGLERLSFDELLDEMYDNVTHVEPWMSGNARGPSTAFCSLYRLFQLKPTRHQVRKLLESEDAPYVRAVGFLYLRYVGEPRTLWSWFEDFFGDAEEFSPSPNGKAVTMGLYVRELLLDHHYFETLFPRIPEVVSRQIKDGFSRLGYATAPLGCGGAGGSRRAGGGAADEGGSRRPPSVKAALAVSLGQRAPHVVGGRESGRGFANVDPSARGAPPHAEALSERPPERREERREERRRSPARERRRSRSRSRSRDRRRSRSRERRRSRSRERRRSRSRERRRSRSPPRHAREPAPQGRPAHEVFRAAPPAEAQGRPTHDVFRAAPPPQPGPGYAGRY